MTYRKLDLTGKTYGKLTGIRALDRRDRGVIVWVFKCAACGNECEIGGSFVTKGDRRDCGCTRTIVQNPPDPHIERYLNSLKARKAN